MQKIFYTEEELIKKGYDRSVSYTYQGIYNTDTLFQKAVKSSLGSIKYYINCWWYHGGLVVDEGELMWTVQFHHSDDQTVDVEMFGNYTAEQVEQEMEDVFQKMGFLNYSDCR